MIVDSVYCHPGYSSICPFPPLPAVLSYGSITHPNPWSHSPDVARHRKESGSPYDHAARGSYGNRSAHQAWACRGYCAGTTGHQKAWGLDRMGRLPLGPCSGQSPALGCCRRFALPPLPHLAYSERGWIAVIHEWDISFNYFLFIYQNDSRLVSMPGLVDGTCYGDFQIATVADSTSYVDLEPLFLPTKQ